jgi:zinc transport system substrate-binding protein
MWHSNVRQNECYTIAPFSPLGHFQMFTPLLTRCRSCLRQIFRAALLLSLIAPALAADPVRLVATIKPLQLIAQAVAGDTLAVELLIDPRQSHHDYHLRPSDRARLARADLVLWVGPSLEGFLTRTMRSLTPATRVVMLGPELPAPAHQEHGTRHHHHHGELAQDGHIWLDPARAVAMARQIAAELSVLMPEQRLQWQHNSERFAEAMAELDKEFAEQFQALEQPRSYLVMHDAYGHFERHYGLQRTATYSATPEQQPGVRHFSALAQAIDAGRIGCVFSEPQYRAAALERLVRERSDIRVVELDLMAGAQTVEPDGFVRFYASFAQAFLSCLRQ